jgi:phage gp29-like protein
MAAADGATKALPVINTVEIATPYGRLDMFRQFLQADGQLWNEDQVLQLEAGGDLRQYKDLLRDDHVKSTIEQRFTAVTAATWSVEPGDDSAIAKEAAEFVEANLERIGYDNVTRLALFAVFYGFSVTELLWDVIDWKGAPKFQWKAAQVRDRARFLFTPAGECYLNTTQANNAENRIWCRGTLDEPYFWIISTGDDYSDNPYGLGLAHQCFWLVRFKRDCIRWWMVYNEKYAMPTTVGTFPSGTSDEDIQRLLSALRSVLTENGIAIPATMTLANLEAKRQGSSDYKDFCTFIDEAISKVVLGQTLTTQVGSSGGNRALGQVHEGVSAKIQKSDSDLATESFNKGPITWLVQRNFGMDCPLPRVRREIEEKADLTELGQQLVWLDQLGFRPTLDLITDNWGAEFEDLGPPQPIAPVDPLTGLPKAPSAKPPNAPPNAANAKQRKSANDARFAAIFAAAAPRLFPDQAALDFAVDALGVKMSELASHLIVPLVDFADSVDPNQVLAHLSVAMPEWKDADLRQALSRTILVAKTFGHAYADRP